MGLEAVDRSVLHVHRDVAHALAVLHHQVQREELDEELAVVLERLAVECVEHGVAGPVLDAGAAVGLPALAEIQRLPAERALVARI